MTPKLKFTEGEKVLCFHGPLIYEAKALKSTITKDKQIKYYIHYAGWNKNWDEWVPENRVLKYNEANVQRQKEVFKQHSTSAGRNKKATPKGKKGETGSATPKDGASSGGSESRASTPSKELNTTPLAAPTTSRNRSKSTATPVNPANASTPIAANASSKESSNETSTKKDQESRDDTSADVNNKEQQEANKKKRGAASLSSSEKSSASSAASGAGGSAGGGGAATTNTPNTTTTITTNTAANSATATQRLDACVESEEHFLSKVEVKIKIPDELKQCLADDWDAITRQHKLIDIPAKITVQDIIDQYLAFKKTSKSTNASKEVAINDVLNGIIEYFNVMLGSQLLYKFERPQYAEILQQHPETPLSKLYGAFHLLRLFVKLGSMLGFSALDEKSMQTLLGHLNDFLKFLVKNSATYFSMTNFVNVSPEYHRNTQ